MPMRYADILEGALSLEAENKLLARLTGLLLQHEGVAPARRPASRDAGADGAARGEQGPIAPVTWASCWRPVVACPCAPQEPGYRAHDPLASQHGH
jgi:hypothetical protein